MPIDLSSVKILIATRVFAPQIGGVETVAALLARALCGLGHEVTILTSTAANSDGPSGTVVVRKPSPIHTFRLYLKTDAVILMGATVRLGWPLFFLSRPALISHQGFPPAKNPGALAGWIRRAMIRRTRHVACSRALANALGYPCETVGNPYDDEAFQVDSSSRRERELIFVGRLVPEKGADVLLDALHLLGRGGLKPRLTIVGAGPMLPALEAQARRLNLGAQVEFTGPVVGKPLAALLNCHRILVVPSRWNEPFGIVALEGIACGCLVAGSSGGGLPEAIGNCGGVFPNGDASALAFLLERLLRDAEHRNPPEACIEQHLERHRPRRVAKRYLEVLDAGIFLHESR